VDEGSRDNNFVAADDLKHLRPKLMSTRFTRRSCRKFHVDATGSTQIAVLIF
jgi:hypothetical protein